MAAVRARDQDNRIDVVQAFRQGKLVGDRTSEVMKPLPQLRNIAKTQFGRPLSAICDECQTLPSPAIPATGVGPLAGSESCR